MESYSKLARKFQAVNLEECVRRVQGVEMRLRGGVAAGPPLTIQADPDQLEQLLINLLRNARAIGLVLSRQIAEAHGGSLSLHDRTAGRGCEARLRLPL